MAIFDEPKRFSRQWVQRKVPLMDSTEFHAMFHETATRDTRNSLEARDAVAGCARRVGEQAPERA